MNIKKLFFVLLLFSLILLAGCVSKEGCEFICRAPSKCVQNAGDNKWYCVKETSETSPKDEETEPTASDELKGLERGLEIFNLASAASALPVEEVEISPFIYLDPIKNTLVFYEEGKAIPIEEITGKKKDETPKDVVPVSRVPKKLDSTKDLFILVNVDPTNPKAKDLIDKEILVVLNGLNGEVTEEVPVKLKVNDKGFAVIHLPPNKLPLGIEETGLQIGWTIPSSEDAIPPLKGNDLILVASLPEPPTFNVSGPKISVTLTPDRAEPASEFDSGKCSGADQKGESCVGKLLTWCRNLNNRDPSYTCNTETGCCESVSQSTIGDKVVQPLITLNFNEMLPITQLVKNTPQPFFVEITSNKPNTPYNLFFTNPKTLAKLLTVQGTTNFRGKDLAKIFVCEEKKDEETPSTPNVLIVSGPTAVKASFPENKDSYSSIAAANLPVTDSHQAIAVVLPTESKPLIGITALTTLALQRGSFSGWTPPHEELACPSTNNRTARFGTDLGRQFNRDQQDVWSDGQAIDNLFSSLKNDLQSMVERKELTPKAAEKQGNDRLNQEAASRWGANAQVKWNQYQGLKNQLNQQAGRIKQSVVNKGIDRIKKGKPLRGDETLGSYLNCLEGTFSCPNGCTKDETPPTESIEFDLSNGRVVFVCERTISCLRESTVGCNLRVSPENPPEVVVAFLNPLTSLPEETTTSTDPNTPSKDVFLVRDPNMPESQPVSLALTIDTVKKAFIAKKTESLDKLKQNLVAYVNLFNDKVENNVADGETCYGHNTSVEKLSTSVSIHGEKVSGDSFSLLGIQTGVGEIAKCEKTSCGPRVCGTKYGCAMPGGDEVKGFCKPLAAAIIEGPNGIPTITRGGTDTLTTTSVSS